MVRSASKKRVSNHAAAPSFETRRCATLLRMRRREGGELVSNNRAELG